MCGAGVIVEAVGCEAWLCAVGTGMDALFVGLREERLSDVKGHVVVQQARTSPRLGPVHRTGKME